MPMLLYLTLQLYLCQSINTSYFLCFSIVHLKSWQSGKNVHKNETLHMEEDIMLFNH